MCVEVSYMVHSGKLEVIARKKGVTVRELIKEALVKRGSITGAAMDIGVMPASLRHWLKSRRLQVSIEYRVKFVQQKEPTA
ncbi:MAG: hypothetical protein DYG88_07335 [Chloroflexi bacterium CFX4]|nr:hypothetical protein [Chloroflexi bacterium CFX4]MDL1921974.1 hypothetical protein [Chloroflexi bacterium CFX3]